MTGALIGKRLMLLARSLANRQGFKSGLVAAAFLLSFIIPATGLLDQYVQLILMYIGINIILTVSLNLINGYMGEFSVGHAGFMAVGAYIASVISVHFFPAPWGPWLFPAAVAAGGLAAAATGLLVAFPSFKTRGDYLAIVTLAFCMIVKSAIENINVLGGPRGFLGMERLTTLPWVFFWTALSILVIRNLVYSRVKMLAFVVSSFFAGVAGALFAHLLQFINPRVFDIIKSTDILIMVYLGGVGSLGGSIIGAVIYTVLLELLRPLGVWRMVLMPLVLVLLMIYRPKGIMGLREFSWFVPAGDLNAGRRWQRKKGAVYGPP
jgi:branched-chain amino acid transport system permease protein